MNWAYPDLLHWLWVAGGIGLILVWAHREHGRRVRSLFTGAVLERVYPTRTRQGRWIRDVCILLGSLSLVLALAEPRFGKEIREIHGKGVDMVLVIDLSHSMNARDIEPSRLERVRREVKDLLGLLQGDRVGVVVYAGGAYARLPLTQDYDAVEWVVNELDTSMFQSQGSALDAAIRSANTLLERQKGEAGRAILILSDGEVHRRDDVMAAVAESEALGVTIYTLGIGREAAPIPLPNGAWMEKNGQPVLSYPDPDLLKVLAQRTGGAFVQSIASAEDVRTLYEVEMRQYLRAVEQGSQEREIWKSGFQWPLGVALFLLLFGYWVGDGRRRWGAAIVLFLALGVPSEKGFAAPLSEGHDLFSQGQFGVAAEAYAEAVLADPDSAATYGWLGAARYRSGDYEGAARAFESQSQIPGPHGTESLYNLANAQYMAGRLERAIGDYERVLEREPGHKDATHNRDLATQELQRRRQAPPPPPPPEQGSDGDQESQSNSEGSDNQGGDGAQQSQESGSGSQEGSSEEQGASPDQAQDQEAQETQSGSASEEGEAGEKQNTAQGNNDPGEEEGEGQAGSEQGEDQEGQSSQSAGAQPGDASGMAKGEAHRLLDSVEEGHPRTTIYGGNEENPW